jgi:hypothetical protein
MPWRAGIRYVVVSRGDGWPLVLRSRNRFEVGDAIQAGDWHRELTAEVEAH